MDLPLSMTMRRGPLCGCDSMGENAARSLTINHRGQLDLAAMHVGELRGGSISRGHHARRAAPKAVEVSGLRQAHHGQAQWLRDGGARPWR
jgi:hypothetical protein